MDCIAKNISGLERTKIKSDEKIIVLQAELERNEKLTLTEWINEHPERKV